MQLIFLKSTNVSIDDITGDSISAKELNNVLGSLSDKVDLVGADACLMGMTEFAYEIRHNASVFVGSQELEPGMGWNYSGFQFYEVQFFDYLSLVIRHW